MTSKLFNFIELDFVVFNKTDFEMMTKIFYDPHLLAEIKVYQALEAGPL